MGCVHSRHILVKDQHNLQTLDPNNSQQYGPLFDLQGIDDCSSFESTICSLHNVSLRGAWEIPSTSKPNPSMLFYLFLYTMLVKTI